MKLVELLACEWSEWPGNCDYAVCDSDGEIRAIGTGTNNDFYPATAVDLEDRLNGTALLVPDDGKRVTRSDWSAERARIAKPAKKADKDGWIRHRGGKCPVEAGVKVDYRMRDGEIDCFGHDAGRLHWSHEPDDCDIMAYRLHKPAEQVEARSKPNAYSGTLHGIEVIEQDGPLKWRDRIAEIDVEVQALTTERAELVQKLASEGFALIGRATDSAAVLPRDQWKLGDLVVRVRDGEESGMPLNEPMKITFFDGSNRGQDVEVGGKYFPNVSSLLWHSRPSA